MAFEPITTQEAFDAAIGERIKREKELADKKIKELEAQFTNAKKDHDNAVANLQKEIEERDGKITAFETEKTELTNKISGYETNSAKMRIAHETGLPFELAGRLSGKDENEIRSDAEAMKKIIGATNVPPLGDTEPPAAGNKEAEYKSMLNNLKGDE